MGLPNISTEKRYHFTLRWKDFLLNMVQIFSDLKHEGQFVDVTLMCEEQEIKAHKIVLAACSDFFMNLFKNISEVHPIIKFSDISFSHLKKMIKFIYEGEVKVLDKDLPAVLLLGEMFGVKHFLNMVQIFSDLKHEGQLVDVTLMCEEQEIKAHKIVLAACSDFFMNLFKNLSEVHPIIKFSDVSFSHLKKMIKFIYEGEVKVLDKDLPAVLLLGEMFGVKGLSALKMKDQENSSNNHVNKPVKYTILNVSSALMPIKEHRPPSLDDQINEPTQKKMKVESCESNTIPMEESIIVRDDSN